MFTTHRTYNLSVIGLMAIYSVLCFAVPELLKSMTHAGPGALLIGVSPAYPIAGVLVLYIRQLRSYDEMEQKIQFLALAISSGIVLISATAYGFIVLHLDYPDFPLFLILPAFLTIWAVSLSVLKRGYR
jgi:hypothetical protein